MKHSSFTTLVVVFLSVGTMMLPSVSKAQGKKCEQAIKRAEKLCGCTIKTAKNEKEHKRRSRRHRRIKGDGPVIASRQPDGSYVFNSIEVEDGDTTFISIRKKENGDSIITWITDNDTTQQEITTSTTLTKRGDTLTERNVIEDDEVIISEKVIRTKCVVPIPITVVKPESPPAVIKTDTVVRMKPKRDTLEWNYIPTIGKKSGEFKNIKPRAKNYPELIELIFDNFPNIEWVHVKHTGTRNLLILIGTCDKNEVRELIDRKLGRIKNPNEAG